MRRRPAPASPQLALLPEVETRVSTLRNVHGCHARACLMPVKPELLMCPRHWRQVPRDIQLAVWRGYRKGQCDDKRVSREWLTAADAAIGYVALREQKSVSTSEAKALASFGIVVPESWLTRPE